MFYYGSGTKYVHDCGPVSFKVSGNEVLKIQMQRFPSQLRNWIWSTR